MLRSESFFRIAGITTIVTIIAAFICGFVFFAPAEAAGKPDKTVTTPQDSPAATFPGTNVGAIPDGNSPCPSIGAPRDVAFTVSGLSGPRSSVAVSVTFGSPNHTWMGDITATLIAP